MKLTDIILLSLSAALVIVGTHLTITMGLTASYPIFMFSVVLLFWYRYRKNNQLVKEGRDSMEKSKKSKPKGRK
jgi:uncharacterized membrane protein